MNDMPAQGHHQEDVMEEHIGSATLLGHGRTAEVYAWKEDSALKLFVPGFPSRLIDQEVEGTQAANTAGKSVV
jgi:hypothetical protein